MKITRRRRPLRPCPSRAQIRQQIARHRRQLQLFRLEWLLEARRQNRNLNHLKALHDRILECRDDLDAWERC
ncbi:MAG TPA: hypothetical protein VMT34_07705 [Aggregatilineales bacterium]|nr:hypothetical protein [Aggregatilineales bacterium]